MPPLNKSMEQLDSLYENQPSLECRGENEPWRAMYSYRAQCEEELSLQKGDIVTVCSKDPSICGGEGWWLGIIDGIIGVFPANFVEPVNSPNPLPRSLTVDLKEIDLKTLHFGDVIGEGGFGKVYKGTYRSREVAIKVAHSNQNENLENVKQEAKMLSLFDHKNIVSLIGVCLQQPKLCLVMEFAKGGPLNRVLAVHKLKPTVLVNWAIQIASGMYYLHYEAPISLIHRDLKSSNVLLSKSIVNDDGLQFNTLKITDFGLARESYKTTRMSAAGTYAWMAPEVMRENTYSKASDVWSFGVCLWEKVTGQVPYKNLDPYAVIYGVATNKLALPIPHTCPQLFKTLMKGCWEIDPHKRPSFETILGTLREIEVSPFIDTPHESFHMMQDVWKEEIEKELRELQEKDRELRSREEELNQFMINLKVREEAVNAREMEVFGRELALIMQKVSPPPPPKRPQFKFLWKFSKPQKISPPSGFLHKITVQRQYPEKTPCFPPDSPRNTHGLLIKVPVPSGVHPGNKTWSPSSCRPNVRGSILPCHPHEENPKRMSKSAPNLEKQGSPRDLGMRQEVLEEE